MGNELQEVYTINGQLTFILTETKIIVKTPNQTMLVEYDDGNYIRKWERLRTKIRNGEIRSIAELVEYNSPRIGNSARIQGLIMTSTRLKRHVHV